MAADPGLSPKAAGWASGVARSAAAAAKLFQKALAYRNSKAVEEGNSIKAIGGPSATPSVTGALQRLDGMFTGGVKPLRSKANLEKPAPQNEPEPQTQFGSFLYLLKAFFWAALAASLTTSLCEGGFDRLIVGFLAGITFSFVMAFFHHESKERFGRGFGTFPKVVRKTSWAHPATETYYMIRKSGGSEKVYISEGKDIEIFVSEYNDNIFGDNKIVRVVSPALQSQRFASGRDGTVWPKTPTFDVHFDDGVVSTLNLRSSEIDGWAANHSGGRYKIEAICDDSGYVVWPSRDGSRVL